MPISQNYGRITIDWLNVLVLNLKHNDTPEHHEQMKSFFKLHKHEEQTVLLHYSRPQLLLCSVPFHVNEIQEAADPVIECHFLNFFLGFWVMQSELICL